MTRRFPIAVWLLALPFASLAAAPQLRAPAEVRDVLVRFLDLGALAAADEPARLTAERKVLRDTARLLTTEGYFSPRVALRQDGSERLLDVDPGPRALIGTVDIAIDGDIAPDRRQALIDAWTLKTGQPFRQAAWDEAKQALLAELLAVEHAGARLRATRADVDPEARRVDLSVRADAGPRYRFGELKIEGQQRYSAAFIARLNDSVKAGDAYREDRLLALQTALQGTPYFSSVSVTLERDDQADDRAEVVSGDGRVTAPVRVLVRERQPYQLSFGGGYSSNTGARVEGTFRNTDLFGRAWELQTGMRFEQVRQTAYADIFLPPVEKGLRQGVGVSVENSDIQDLGIARFALGATRTRQDGRVEQHLGVAWQQERQSPQGASATTNRALAAQIGWTWRNARDPLDPADGTSLQFQLGGGSKQLLSDQNFLRTYFRYSQGVPLGARDALLFRAELGATFARSSRGIPQDFLFRAGGGNSVRGYAYQSLGVQQGTATLGGRYLATASGEYTHWFDKAWGAAAFVDAGNAVDDRGALNPVFGYGVGARWKSPAGPLGVDLAYGQRDANWRLEFSLAVPF